MKRKLVFLLGIFLILSIIVGVRFYLVNNSHKTGRLKILTSPTTDVLINSKSYGQTPFDQTLSEGEYSLQLNPDPQIASNAASWAGKIKIHNNTMTFVSRELGSSDISSSGVIFSVEKMTEKPSKKNTGEVEVNSDPSGSIVYLDNEEQGIAPLLLKDVIPGDHELSVSSPGFFRRSQKIRVENGYRIVTEYKLAIDPSHKNVDEIENQPDATESAEIKNTQTTPGVTKALTPAAEENTTSIGFQIVIKETETGWLRVRTAPSLYASEAGKVNPGDSFTVLKQENGWYQIKYDQKNTGWVSSNYVEKSTNP